jgi:ribosome-associated toxin RatA of RatAB toxin-antitoxin module|tara:strand:+ start:4426 stop:4965 length:540 start_codon:yes stop_codon:yes gene_type:complete
MKTRVFLVTIYVVIFVTLVTIVNVPDEMKSVDRTIEFSSIVSSNRVEIFNLIADVEKYPLIFPNTFTDVQISEKSHNTFKTFETAKEAGIKKTFEIQHDLIPFEFHKITILDGNAIGTSISIWFDDVDENNTKISIKLNLNLKGILVPFGFLPDSNIEHAFGTILKGFSEYLETNPVLK